VKLLKWLDNTFLFLALLGSVPLFSVLFIGYMDTVADMAHPASVAVTNLVIFFSYLYWLVRGLWHCTMQHVSNRGTK
jgi:hypothetical protein